MPDNSCSVDGAVEIITKVTGAKPLPPSNPANDTVFLQLIDP